VSVGLGLGGQGCSEWMLVVELMFVQRVKLGAGVGGRWWSLEIVAMVRVKSKMREGGRVPAAMVAGSDKAVVRCKWWRWANLVGVHRASLGCVLLHVVGCGSAGWIIVVIVISVVVIISIVVIVLVVVVISVVIIVSDVINCDRRGEIWMLSSRC